MVTVRTAAMADIECVASLFDRYRQFYGQPSDPARALDWICQRLSRAEATVLLGEDDGRAAGFALLYPSWSSVSTAAVLILNDLYVDDSARRRGVATALLHAAAEVGRARGVLRISLETARDNDAAQALYRHAGWSADATQWFHLALRPSTATVAHAGAPA